MWSFKPAFSRIELRLLFLSPYLAAHGKAGTVLVFEPLLLLLGSSPENEQVSWAGEAVLWGSGELPVWLKGAPSGGPGALAVPVRWCVLSSPHASSSGLGYCHPVCRDGGTERLSRCCGSRPLGGEERGGCCTVQRLSQWGEGSCPWGGGSPGDAQTAGWPGLQRHCSQ